MNKGIIRNYLQQGIAVVPLYSSESRFYKDFLPGPTVAYQAALHALPLTSKTPLAGIRSSQFNVIETRSRNIWYLFPIMAKDGLGARSVEEATEIIQKKLDDYGWAIQKHGLKTITGAMSSILDSKAIVQIAAGTGVAGLLAGPIWGAIAGGMVLSSRIATWLADRTI